MIIKKRHRWTANKRGLKQVECFRVKSKVASVDKTQNRTRIYYLMCSSLEQQKKAN
jgi:hypothetical protein